MFLRSQHGAMFSLDARIAVIVGSILAGVVSVQSISRIERTRIETAEQQLQDIQAGLEAYYADSNNNGMPANIAALISSGAISTDVPSTDPWGNAWQYATHSASKTMDGITFDVHYVTAYSYGPDGANDSTLPTSVATQISFTAGDDDISVRYNTFNIDRSRVEIFRSMGQEVIAALASYETTKFAENSTFCTTNLIDDDGNSIINSSDASWTAAKALRCDVNADGIYDLSEEDGLNYFPPAYADLARANVAQATNIYYSKRLDAAAPVYADSDAGMTALLTLLGLPTTYLKDPWGNRLEYNPNLFNTTFAPFKANISWQ